MDGSGTIGHKTNQSRELGAHRVMHTTDSGCHLIKARIQVLQKDTNPHGVRAGEARGREEGGRGGGRKRRARTTRRPSRPQLYDYSPSILSGMPGRLDAAARFTVPSNSWDLHTFTPSHRTHQPAGLPVAHVHSTPYKPPV